MQGWLLKQKFLDTASIGSGGCTGRGQTDTVRKQIDRGGLPRPIRTDETSNLAPEDRLGQAVYGHQPTKPLRQAACLQQPPVLRHASPFLHSASVIP